MSAPLGYWITCDDAECSSCHRPEDWVEFGDWEAPLPIFYGTEGDTPTHCCRCRDLIPHALTDEGYAYVREAVARGEGDPDVLAEWTEIYLGSDRDDEAEDADAVDDTLAGAADDTDAEDKHEAHADGLGPEADADDRGEPES